jgi:integrase
MQKTRTSTAKWNDKRKMWYIAVQKDNERKFFYSSTPGRNGQRECNAKADMWLDEGVENQNIKVSEAFDMYIESLKQSTCEDHYRKYEGYGKNHIKPAIGKKKLSKLNEQDLQDIINECYSKRSMAKKTLEGIRGCLMQFTKFCRKKKLSTLYIDGLTIPKGAKKPQKTILQPEQLSLLMKCDKTLMRGKECPELFVNAFRFEALTGLRPGEIIGLKKSDITGNVIHLQRSINRRGKATAGKNDNAKRSFKLIRYTQNIIQDQLKMLDDNNIETEYIFCNEFGEPIPQATYYKHWIKFRNYNNISDTVSPYELRHTFISMAQSMPKELVKLMAGHSENMDTFGVYGHEVTGDIDYAASLLEDTLENIFNRGEN